MERVLCVTVFGVMLARSVFAIEELVFTTPKMERYSPPEHAPIVN